MKKTEIEADRNTKDIKNNKKILKLKKEVSNLGGSTLGSSLALTKSSLEFIHKRVEKCVIETTEMAKTEYCGGATTTLNPDAREFLPSPKPNERPVPAPQGWDTSSQEMDAVSKQFLTTSLKERPQKPFKGEPQEFHRCWTFLQNRMQPLNLHPVEIIDVLESHTQGPPNHVVNTLMLNKHFLMLNRKSTRTSIENYRGRVTAKVRKPP